MINLEAKLRKLICQCIKEHKVLWLSYKSKSGEHWRKVDPYILAIKDNGEGNTFFTGYVYPSKEAKRENNNDNQGHYLLNKIDINQLEYLTKRLMNLNWITQRYLVPFQQ